MPVQGQSSELSCDAAAAAVDDNDVDEDDAEEAAKAAGVGCGGLGKFSGSVALMLLCASRIQF